MSTASRSILVWAALGVLFGGAALWAYGRMARSRELFLIEARRTADTERLLAAIQELRSALATSADSGDVRPEMAIRRKVDAAAREAAVSAQVLRIEQQAPQRLAQSAYLQHALELVLGEVTVEQALVLAHLVSRGDDGLVVRAMKLSQPRMREGQPRWDVQMVRA